MTPSKKIEGLKALLYKSAKRKESMISASIKRIFSPTDRRYIHVKRTNDGKHLYAVYSSNKTPQFGGGQILTDLRATPKQIAMALAFARREGYEVRYWNGYENWWTQDWVRVNPFPIEVSE